jgi:hypothetical protein
MSDQKYDGMPILGVDLDGVCADFYGHMRTIAAEWMEKNQPMNEELRRLRAEAAALLKVKVNEP